MRNRPAAAALLLAATALAAGCNSSDEPTPPPDTTISAPPTAQYLETSERTVTEAVPRNLGAEEAEDFYTESMLRQDREFMAELEEQGIKPQGKNEILWTKQLDYQDPEVGDEQTMVEACVVRNLRFLDGDGNDLTADQQGNELEKGAKTLIHYTLTTPDEGKTWLIDSWTEKGTCTAEQQS